MPQAAPTEFGTPVCMLLFVRKVSVLHLHVMYSYLLADPYRHCTAQPVTTLQLPTQHPWKNQHLVFNYEGLCFVLCRYLFEKPPCFDALNNIVSHFIFIESIGYYG